MDDERLSRAAISAAVTDLGWRFLLGSLRTHVPVASLAEAAALVAGAAAVTDSTSLTADVRADRVVLVLRSPDTGWIGAASPAQPRSPRSGRTA